MMTIEQAVNKGFLRINRGYIGSVQCPNMLAYYNRVTMAAARVYLETNYTRDDVITCEERAHHHGLKVGTVRVIPRRITAKEKAQVIKKVRAYIKGLNNV